MTKPVFGETQYRMVSGQENSSLLQRSRLIAVFVETPGGSYGLMMCGEGDLNFLSKEEQAALIQAAKDSPTRD